MTRITLCAAPAAAAAAAAAGEEKTGAHRVCIA